MTNFHFLQNEWREIYNECIVAEENVYKIPIYSAIISRCALEKIVHWMYENDGTLTVPYETSLATLIHAYEFKSLIGERIFREINIVRKIGNDAAHGKKVSSSDSLNSIKYIHTFASFLVAFYGEKEQTISNFDETILPKENEEKLLKKQVELLNEKLAEQEAIFRNNQEQNTKQTNRTFGHAKTFTIQQNKYTVRRKEREKNTSIFQKLPVNLSEKETRENYINLFLREAGWDQLRKGREIEFELHDMPLSTNPSGKGYADYVLWGKNGLPLAVIEAKKTMSAVEKGRQQALLYADALEKKYNQRPIIFYTNGFETILWDDLFCNPREVSGYYTQEELQLLIDRRISRKDLRTHKPNASIAGRAYQIEAVKRVGEHFSMSKNESAIGLNRRSLLVMATGSGKTRTAASIIDMLTKCNWAKRILFLADRNALVTQAKNAISSLLPNLSSIDLTKEKEDNGTRLVFSTYPTIMNKIDSTRIEEERFYGVGHFDVIFIDEAHRSVYQKYKMIFDYFDALVVGLTATPKKEVDKNTYELFEIEDDNPTFAYELDQAVSEGFLVPPKVAQIDLKFVTEGIKYKELSEKERREYEEKFGDPTQIEVSDEITSSAVNSWLFNKDTVDKALHFLMERGIKVQGGDKLGKTIIFARNHEHALFVEKRFNINYPEYQGHFIRVIDNYETKAQDLLEKFTNSKKEEDPQIAISVDMMDTGVDAPRVVNLMFFKPVKSYSKFWQMIGRGTRLCPDLFGPDIHKTHFLIFDLCRNFEYFSENPEGETVVVSKSISEKIIELKLEICLEINDNIASIQSDLDLRDFYLEELHESIISLDRSRFVVQRKLRYVEKYSIFSNWQNLTKSNVVEINEHLALLPISLSEDEGAKRFDILILTIQLYRLKSKNDLSLVDRVISIAKELCKKTSIPQIHKNLDFLHKIQTENFWVNASLKDLDELRVRMRELIIFLDKSNRSIVFTSFEDQILSENALFENVKLNNYNTRQNYKLRMESYIKKHADHLVLHKLKNNIPITKDELEVLERILFDEKEIGTKDDFIEQFGEQPLGRFIRSIIGLDLHAAQVAFASFLNSSNFNSNQINFIQKIIGFLTKNGHIDKKAFFEPPFTDQHQDGIIGLFDDNDAFRIISIIDQIDQNAQA